MSRTPIVRATAVASRIAGLLLASALATLVPWAGAAPFAISGRVHTEKAVPSVELRVWALGEAVRADAKLLEEPLGALQAKPGQPFSLPVDGAPPLRVEAWAGGHLGATFLLLDGAQRELPPLWLPAGRPVKVRATRDGKPAAGVLMGGLVEGGWDIERVPGQWRASAPLRRTDALGELEVVPSAKGRLELWGRDRDGRWGRLRLTTRQTSSSSLELGSREVLLHVQDERGGALSGAEVAQLGAPLGVVARSGEDGVARLQVVAEGEWRVTARAPGLAGFAALRGTGDAVVVARPAAPAEVAWSGPPAVWLELPHVPAALLGGAWQVLRGGRGPIPPSAAHETAGVWAPGWAPVPSQEVSPSTGLAVRLPRGARVEGVVQDGERRPLAGVPVWCEVDRFAYQNLPPSVMRGLQRPLLPWAVSDAQGKIAIGELPPGPVRLLAVAPGFPPAEWGPTELAAGGVARATLTLLPGVGVRLAVADGDGRPLAGARARLLRRPEGERSGFFAGTLAALADLGELAAGTSGDDGGIGLRNVPPGPAWLHVALPGFVPKVAAVSVPREGGDLGTQVLSPGVDVRIQVLDEDGAGLPDAAVAASSPLLGWRYEAGVTDGAGLLLLPDQPQEGSLGVSVTCTGFRQPGPVQASLPASDGVTVRMVRTRTLVGTVTEAERTTPVEGATVGMTVVSRMTGTGMSFSNDVRSVLTDAEGRFQLDEVPPGEHMLHVQAPGFRDRNDKVVVPEGEDPEPLALTLARGLSVRGRVLDPDGQPAVGVVVYADSQAISESPFRGWSEGSLSVTAQGDGAFLIDGLPRGQVELTVDDRDGASARELVEAGADQAVVLRMRRAGGISGRVRLDDGSPVAGARVNVTCRGPRVLSRDTRTDADGSFEADRLFPCAYELFASSDAGSARQQDVRVEPGLTARVELVIDTGGTVSGRVKGLPAGELRECRVSVGSTSAQPDADGTFVLEHVPAGRRAVVVTSGDGRQFRRVEAEVRRQETTVVEIDLGGITVTGTVRRRAGSASGLEVRALGSGVEIVEHTDADGAFTVRSLPPGIVVLTVSEPRGQRLLQRRETIERDTSLVLEVGGGRLDVRVETAGTREAVAEAAVTVGLGEVERSGRTDAEGLARFVELPSGEARVSAAAPGFAARSGDVSVEEAGTADLVLRLEKEQAVTVLVREPDGRPAEGATLLTFPDGVQADLVPLVCDASGRATVRGLASGVHQVVVYGGTTIAVAVVQVPGPETTVTLRSAARLAVRSPEPRAGVAWQVRVVDPGSGRAWPVRGSGDPRLRLGWIPLPFGGCSAGVPAGPVLVEARAPDGSLQQRQVTASPTETTTVTFE